MTAQGRTLEDGYPDSLGMYRALCWCGAGYVHVTATELRACTTRPCRRPGCRETAPTPLSNPLRIMASNPTPETVENAA